MLSSHAKTAGPGWCRASAGLQRPSLGYPEAGPHTCSLHTWHPGGEQQPGTPGLEQRGRAEHGRSLPVCIFGNRTRIKLKEDDAHGLQGWLCSHGRKVCGKRRTVSCEEQCQRAFQRRPSASAAALVSTRCLVMYHTPPLTWAHQHQLVSPPP